MVFIIKKIGGILLFLQEIKLPGGDFSSAGKGKIVKQNFCGGMVRSHDCMDNYDGNVESQNMVTSM